MMFDMILKEIVSHNVILKKILSHDVILKKILSHDVILKKILSHDMMFYYLTGNRIRQTHRKSDSECKRHPRFHCE